ncbi:unnamed protein product [Vicia faba]|uniref:FACT complex subunit n=1 Tax=Vicia faba TaxID=3906 RepID=A0AAV1A869_VICFA|nr:unnamed protein product [Vicia faba]
MSDHRNGSAQAANGKSSAAANIWGSSDAVAVACPPPSEDLRYLKSTALFLWLLGFEFPETIMVFTKAQIHILCSQKKASIIESVKKSARESVGVEIVLHVKPKNDDGASLMEAINRAHPLLSTTLASNFRFLHAWLGVDQTPWVKALSCQVSSGL